ncbi:MAG: acyloxyacyl hydrolase [Terriglobales bacterium]
MKQLLCLLLLAPACWAQGLPSTSLTKGTWEFGVWGGGGTGFRGSTSDTRFTSFGFRIGRVMTGEYGSGWRRGNLELAADVMPVYLVFQNQTVYGGGVTTPIFRWNFTSRQKVAPFFEAGGGLLYTTSSVPPGTSRINFTPQGAFGFNVFTRERRSISFDARYAHISSAGLGSPNPGIDTVQFRIGFNWFR